jgi:hypothetical protein
MTGRWWSLTVNDIMGTSYLVNSSTELKNYSKSLTLADRESIISSFSDKALYGIVEVLWNIIECGTLKPVDSLMKVLKDHRKIARNLIKPRDPMKIRQLLLKSPSTFKELLSHLIKISLKHSI